MVLLVCLAFASSASAAPKGTRKSFDGTSRTSTPVKDIWDGPIALQSDNGNYLAECDGCAPGSTVKEAAFVHAPDYSSPYAQWTPVRVIYDIWGLRGGGTGRWLSVCDGCVPGASSNWNAMVHGLRPKDEDWAQWMIEILSEDTVALRSLYNGKFLARCEDCIPGAPYKDAAMAYVDDFRGAPHAQWKIVDITNQS